MKKTLIFSECEHEGDLRNYEDDLRDSGATIISSECNYEAETGTIEIEIDDKDYKSFVEKFNETDSNGYCHL